MNGEGFAYACWQIYLARNEWLSSSPHSWSRCGECRKDWNEMQSEAYWRALDAYP